MTKQQKIPFKKLNFMGAYKYVKPLFENGFIGLGNVVFDFEKELAKYVGAKYVIATDSCTSALFLSLKYDKGKSAMIPSMTVPLVANACLEAGKKICFSADTDWVGTWYQIIGTNVYDSAHQLQRNQYRRLAKTNSRAKLCFSFYPTKVIGSADGGAIATNDKRFADWARCISTYGRNQENKYQNSWDYDVKMVGYKRHYTNLQAAICLEQLHRLVDTTIKRRRIINSYNTAFGYRNDSEYLYRINITNRDKFIEYANSCGIECGVHFKPLHLMTPFKDVEMSKDDKKEVEKAYDKTVSLPFYDTMTEADIARVIHVVLDFKEGQLLPQ